MLNHVAFATSVSIGKLSAPMAPASGENHPPPTRPRRRPGDGSTIRAGDTDGRHGTGFGHGGAGAVGVGGSDGGCLRAGPREPRLGSARGLCRTDLGPPGPGRRGAPDRHRPPARHLPRRRDRVSIGLRDRLLTASNASADRTPKTSRQPVSFNILDVHVRSEQEFAFDADRQPCRRRGTSQLRTEGTFRLGGNTDDRPR